MAATAIRWALGVITVVVFFGIGMRMLSFEPRIGGLLLAFGLLRGMLVGRQIYTEWYRAEPAPSQDGGR